MTIDATSAIRMQLLANGYAIIPNRGKVPAITGWADEDYVARHLASSGKGSGAERVARWIKRFPDAPSTGVRLDRTRVVDIDSNSQDSTEALFEEMSRIAPEVYNKAPARYGGGKYKVALFCRLPLDDEEFRRIASRKYVDEKGESHCVEIFGGQPTTKGRCSRQFGIYGPHSFNDDGTVAREYSWHEYTPALHEVPIGDLPELTRAQAFAIVDAFEKIAAELGWTRQAEVASDATSTFTYDITESTAFDVLEGPSGADYETLCDLVAIRGEVRVSSSFIDGGSNRSKCRVSHCAVADAIGVFDTETQAWHLPRDLAPPDEPELAEAIKTLAADLGVPLPEREPNWRERTKSGAPRATLHNARLAIEAAGVRCSEDTFHGKMYMGRSDAAAPAEALDGFVGELTDAAVLGLRIAMSDRYGLDFGEKNVRDAVMAICAENRFDPIVDMLAEAEAAWDGTPRLDRVAADIFKCDDTVLNARCVRKTLIAAVARARRPGCKFDTILVLEGPEGFNKSTAWSVLAGEGNFSDERIIGHGAKEVMEQLAAVWIHENADLAGLRKAEVETVKAFASRTTDRARPAYGHFLVEQPRHSIEVGTTNSDVYLQSQTGNRRFWPMLVRSPIDLKALRATRLQLLGEAAAADTAGESLFLDEHLWGDAAIEQEARRVEHPWEAMLAGMMVVPTDGALGSAGAFGCMVISQVDDQQRVHTKDIFKEVLAMPGVQMNMGHSKTLSEIMGRLGWHRTKTRVDGVLASGYVRAVTKPPK